MLYYDIFNPLSRSKYYNLELKIYYYNAIDKNQNGIFYYVQK
jgi:hypothetical protein